MARLSSAAPTRRSGDGAAWASTRDERQPLRTPVREDEPPRRGRPRGHEAEDERLRPRRRRTAERSETAWERSASVQDEPVRPPREHVSAYLDESSVVRVTRRSDRTRASRGYEPPASQEAVRPRGTGRGFTLVPDAPADEPRRSARAARRAEATRSWQADEAPTLRRDAFFDDYDYDSEGLSGAESRRSAVVDALRAIPEAIGSAVLGLLGSLPARGLVALAAIALAVAMLYGPTRNLYLANRRLDTLQQTYDAVLEQNDQIRHELEVLQTREGIENEARARGYVEPGETKVLVEGLPEEEGTTAYLIEDLELPDKRPWYIRLLDDLFGYEPEA